MSAHEIEIEYTRPARKLYQVCTSGDELPASIERFVRRHGKPPEHIHFWKGRFWLGPVAEPVDAVQILEVV